MIEALFEAFDQHREIATGDLLAAAKEIVPLSVSSAEVLRKSREWAAQRTRPAEAPDGVPGGPAADTSRAAFFELDSHEP